MSILTRERHGAALLLRLNRPEAMNALSTALVREIGAGIAEGGRTAGVRAIVIAGAGEKAFSAGTDLKERASLDAAGKATQSRSLMEVALAIRESPLPVIAAVHGWCLGGGLELALACDLRIAAEDATFGFPEMTLGAYPGSGGPVLLARLVGLARAKEILFYPRRMPATEALTLGVVEQVVPRTGLHEAAMARVDALSSTAPLAIAALKRSLNETISMPFAEALEHDQRLRRPLDSTRDYAEGMLAQREHRKPDFRGE